MISRGLVVSGSSKSWKKAYAREVYNVHSQFLPSKTPRCNKPDIIFFEKDVCIVKQPHNHPLVIMLRLEEFNIHQVLVDNGSSTDIIYLPVFQQMKLSKEMPRPFTSPLVSFIGDKIILNDFIKLTIIAGTYPTQVSKEIDFLVVDCPSTYNVILG